jgi:hypothetical protein
MKGPSRFVGATVIADSVDPSSTSFARAFALLVSALREIFDESAYARFLSRRQMASSREAYAAFCREYEAAKGRRPRCC